VRNVRRTIYADADAVWSVLADPTTYPDWLVGAQVIRDVDDDFPNPGSGFHHAVGVNEGASVPDSTTVLAAQPGRSLALKVRARPFFQGVAHFRLVPVKGGTEVLVGEEPLGVLRVMRPLLEPLIAARNNRSLDRLRVLVESRSSPPLPPAAPAG
jgi:uncharacterized protein YndB with AHSA1/START domain